LGCSARENHMSKLVLVCYLIPDTRIIENIVVLSRSSEDHVIELHFFQEPYLYHGPSVCLPFACQGLTSPPYSVSPIKLV
jgi:hypothetical protein